MLKIKIYLNKNYANIKYSLIGRKFMILAFIGIVSITLGMNQSFKSSQKKFSRVKSAYIAKEKGIQQLMVQKGLDYSSFSLILIGYKYEKQLCVFASDKSSDKYKLLTTYDFCVLSGDLGPKRREGDNQVPEGLYEISNFNPQSNYHLSLKVNYPNASDKILSDQKKPGGDIYIHGNCVSIGCIPITDDLIKELYVMCVETKNRGNTIPIYIFPCKMTESKTEKLLESISDAKLKSFWKNLKTWYEKFNAEKCKLKYKVDKSGKYVSL